jgi:hypothetical protein
MAASTSTTDPSCPYGIGYPPSPTGYCPALSAFHSFGVRYDASRLIDPLATAKTKRVLARRASKLRSRL